VLILLLTEERPSGDKGLVVKLGVFKGRNDTLKVEKWHKVPELKVDGGSIRFAGNVAVHGVMPLVVVAKVFIEDIPDERLVHIVLVDALLELAVGVGMRSISEHWNFENVSELLEQMNTMNTGKGGNTTPRAKGRDYANRRNAKRRATCRLK
jgi:hypothetical protein